MPLPRPLGPATMAQGNTNAALSSISSAVGPEGGLRHGVFGDGQWTLHNFRDLIDIPATITSAEKEVEVIFHRRSHIPVILASRLVEGPVQVP